VELYFMKHETAETQLQNKGEILDHVCETVESDHQTLTQLSDLIRKMQKEMKPEQTTSKKTSGAKSKSLRLKNYISEPTVHFAATAKPQETPLITQKLKLPKK
jgi:hypothetical protein